MATGFCRLLTIRQNAHKLHFHPSNAAMSLWINPHERDGDLAFLEAYLKEGDFVIDVGSNIGETVLVAAQAVGTGGRVVAFERHPRTHAFLKGNLELNWIKNVDTHQIGVGDVHGTFGFTNDRREDLNRVTTEDPSLQVRLERLDDLIIWNGRISLLKVDVEGYEKFVLLGAPNILSRTDCVHFEVCESNFSVFNYTISDLLCLVSSYGFRIFRIVEPGLLASVENNLRMATCENLVGIRDVNELRSRTGWRL